MTNSLRKAKATGRKKASATMSSMTTKAAKTVAGRRKQETGRKRRIALTSKSRAI
jgi:hypothetical protein